MQMSSNHGEKLEGQECEPSRLGRKFAEEVHDPILIPLLPVIRELMRLLPSNRITAYEALCQLEDADKVSPSLQSQNV